jgi:hypothetical protein
MPIDPTVLVDHARRRRAGGLEQVARAVHVER